MDLDANGGGLVECGASSLPAAIVHVTPATTPGGLGAVRLLAGRSLALPTPLLVPVIEAPALGIVLPVTVWEITCPHSGCCPCCWARGISPADLWSPFPHHWEDARAELVTYLGQAALGLAALLVVLALFICVVTLVIHAVRKVRQMYEL